jgi:hypothetical protein
MWRAKAPLQEAADKIFAPRQFVIACNPNVIRHSHQGRARVATSGESIAQSLSEPIMPAYDICYLDQDGSLTYKFSATCDDDQRAKILAHAMKLPSAKKLEVWSGQTLIYARPSLMLERHIADRQALRA